MNIDFIGIINVDNKEFNDTMIPLGVEVKNKINSNEVTKEQKHIRRLKRSKYERISSDKCSRTCQWLMKKLNYEYFF